MPLATIERIESVWAHPNADKLDFARVLGYDCIVGRGAYLPGDVVVLAKYGDELEEIAGRPFEGVVLKGSDFSMKVVNKAYDARK